MTTELPATEHILPELLNLRKALPALGLSLLWFAESVRPVISGRPNRFRHAIRNLTLTFFNTIIAALCFGALTIHVASEAAIHERGALFLLPMNLTTRVVAGVILLDFWTWAWHRCNHRIKLLWRFHRVHHTDDAMDVTTAARFHPGELVLSSLLKLPFIVAIGLSPMTLLIHETLLVAVSQLHHAAISLGTADRVLSWFLVTPQMHRIHHSREIAETNSNYASILSVWDRLFGTYRSKLQHPGEPTGLQAFSSPEFQTVPGMLKTPWIHSHDKESNSSSNDSTKITSIRPTSE